MTNKYYDREIINRGEGFYEVECAECGKWFESQRYDAVFCSSTCRSRNHRMIQKLDTDLERLNTLVDDLVNRMPSEGESKTYLALTKLRNRLDNVLALVEVKHEDKTI